MNDKDDAARKLQTINQVFYILGVIAIIICAIYCVVNAKTVTYSHYTYKTEWSPLLALLYLLICAGAWFCLWIEKLIVDCFCNRVNYTLQIRTMMAEKLYLSTPSSVSSSPIAPTSSSNSKWVCKKCHKENAFYIGTCSCGSSRF